MKRGFDILPEQAPEWADEEIEPYLYALEQHGRLRGRDRAIELLTEQGRWPIPETEVVPEKKPRAKAAAKKEEE